jgi:hypothetical protein
MWHALRAELAYNKPWLLGGLGLAVAVVIIVSVVFFAVGDEGPPAHAAAGIRGMFLFMAPTIVGFIIQTFRSEERRARLLLAGPLTPRQLAGLNVLLPVVLFAIGVLAAALMLGLDFLVTGKLALESLHIVAYVGGMIFMGLMIGLLVQEATAAHRQQRLRAAATGWASLVVGVLLLAAVTVAVVFLQGPLSWPILHLGNLIVAVTAMVATVFLYSGRTDFTR